MHYFLKFSLFIIAVALMIINIVVASKRRRLFHLHHETQPDLSVLRTDEYAQLYVASRHAIQTRGDKIFVHCGLGGFASMTLAIGLWGLIGAIENAAMYQLHLSQLIHHVFTSDNGLSRQELFSLQPLIVAAMGAFGTMIMTIIWYQAVYHDKMDQLLGRIFVRLLDLDDKSIPAHLRPGRDQ